MDISNRNECFYCGCELVDKNRTRDHFNPKSLGFKLTDNRIWCCRPCNKAKDNLSLEEFQETKYFKFFCKRFFSRHKKSRYRILRALELKGTE